MAIPASRQEFKDHCLRRLGYPTINIEVTEEQIDDRVDEALYYYKDYHFDAADKIYYKHLVTANNFPDKLYDVRVDNGGTGYSNADTVVFTGGLAGVSGTTAATATLVTDNSGTITDITLDTNGDGYGTAPTVSINTGTGSGFSGTALLGGYIPLPENILGAVRVFPVGQALGSNDIFNIRYQIALNDLYTLTSVSMVPYFSAFQHIELIQEILVGQQPIRYSRHRDRVYLDMNWSVVNPNTFLLIEAYEVVDPAEFTDVWGDRWLQLYCTALIKKQWGEQLSKYSGMMLPGNLQFNGERILEDAKAEIEALEFEAVRTWSIPPEIYVG